jgi:membrane protease YdiL (CAAX protease family)
MITALALWRRVPVVVRAVVAGWLVTSVGTGLWVLLTLGNQKYFSSVPWAMLPAAGYLWLFWRYLGGAGWPRETAAARRASLRANDLPPEVWSGALGAGLLGLIWVLVVQMVLNRMVRLPQQIVPDTSHIPAVTLVGLLFMAAIVAGVVEEAAFRGYMQGPIERRHGPIAAILITGVMFGVAHFTHPEVTLVLMPYYVAVAAVYGGLAYITNSILPSLVLHAGGNMFMFLGQFGAGRSEWQATAAPLVWETGPDVTFVVTVVAAAVLGAAVFWAYRGLAGAVRAEQIDQSRLRV